MHFPHECNDRPEVSPLYPEERQHAIAALVTDRGRVSVTDVAERFGVTTETVRRDLALLERAGMLRRVHGGAVPIGALSLVEPGLGERHATRSEQKRKIASAALDRSEEHTSELQSRQYLVCRLLLEKKNHDHHSFSLLCL